MISTPEELKKFITDLLVIDSLFLITGYLLINFAKLEIQPGDIVILILSFSLIALLTFFIFLKGQKRDPGSSTMYLFVAISLKLLLEMVLALFWFLIGKKDSTTLLLLFFVLYLAFSLFSILNILNTLRRRSL